MVIKPEGRNTGKYLEIEPYKNFNYYLGITPDPACLYNYCFYKRQDSKKADL